MSYHVAILNNEDTYQNLYTSNNGSSALEFYNARVDENFASQHSLSTNTNNLNLVCFELTFDDMTEEQKTNLSIYFAACYKSLFTIAPLSSSVKLRLTTTG
jgi:hypothetical protein